MKINPIVQTVWYRKYIETVLTVRTRLNGLPLTSFERQLTKWIVFDVNWSYTPAFDSCKLVIQKDYILWPNVWSSRQINNKTSGPKIELRRRKRTGDDGPHNWSWVMASSTDRRRQRPAICFHLITPSSAIQRTVLVFNGRPKTECDIRGSYWSFLPRRAPPPAYPLKQLLKPFLHSYNSCVISNLPPTLPQPRNKPLTSWTVAGAGHKIYNYWQNQYHCTILYPNIATQRITINLKFNKIINCNGQVIFR